MATAGSNVIKNVYNAIRAKRSVLFYDVLEVYKPAMTRNKENMMRKIYEHWKTAKGTEIVKKLEIASDYVKVEMSPPYKPSEWKVLQNDVRLVKDFFHKGAYKFMTVRQAWLLFLVCLEVWLWFFLGETIGKFHLVGYKV
ncbi:hypothetical protein JYU34_010987 [Plutella xylostella]|uniref:Uncharacterized protein n=2 Tax=Plutella xylostella TaxID=51655 RepID=A0ABQ7QFS4_PLUXY|nr:ATP synthase subunit g, mitochondrial [Plutella xylostella]KAG7304061.1 hypothetical protein JYU34_010987 [Plutella xylostella]CAG9110442.1 unnamed protein product [Plutella xylostella]